MGVSGRWESVVDWRLKVGRMGDFSKLEIVRDGREQEIYSN